MVGDEVDGDGDGGAARETGTGTARETGTGTARASGPGPAEFAHARPKSDFFLLTGR